MFGPPFLSLDMLPDGDVVKDLVLVLDEVQVVSEAHFLEFGLDFGQIGGVEVLVGILHARVRRVALRDVERDPSVTPCKTRLYKINGETLN